MKREQLTLMGRCLEGIAEEAEYAEFIALLDQEPELLALYAKEINTIADLEWYHAIESNLQDSVRRRAELSDEMCRRQQTQARWIGIAAAAAIMVFGFGYGSYRLLEARPTATLEASAGASWSVQNTASEPVQTTRLRKGYTVTLKRGIMDIEFQDGVVGTLEGPARFELRARKLVKLSEGRLFINVREDEGKGFTVETQGLKAVDLGTRFGVVSSPEGADEVHVQQGNVLVSSKTGTDRQRLDHHQAIRLMRDGKLARIPEKSSSFMESIQPDFPPFVHWSFDFLTPKGFPSEGTLPGAASFPAKISYLREVAPPPVAPGKIGGALSLHGQGDFAVTRFPAISKDEAFAITGWFKADASAMYSYADTPRRNLLSWGAFDQENDADGVSIDFPRYGLGKTGFSTVLGTPGSRTIYRADYLDGHWHHFASVSTGKPRTDGSPEIFQYIDGERLDSEVDFSVRPTVPLLSPRSAQPLRFGIAAVPLATDLSTFATSIDEVRVFHGALTERQIRNLFSENLKPLATR